MAERGVALPLSAAGTVTDDGRLPAERHSTTAAPYSSGPSRPEARANAGSISSSRRVANKLRGTDYFFLPGRGYFPSLQGHRLLLGRAAPNQTLKHDRAADFVRGGFYEFLKLVRSTSMTL